MINPSNLDPTLSFGFQGALVVAAAIMTVLMTGLFYYVKRAHDTSDKQWESIARIEKSQAEQSVLLARIEVRMENYEEIKRRQEHDHKDLRSLDRLVDDIVHRVSNLEDGQRNIRKFCREVHGERIQGESIGQGE